MKRLPLSTLFFLIFTFSFLTVGINTCGRRNEKVPESKETNKSNDTTSLSLEIQAILEKKIALLETLARNEEVLNILQKANTDNSKYTQDQILELDDQWHNSLDTAQLIASTMHNSCALYFITFQEENPGFPEIFLTDKHGLNVAQTNRTTDYYQADENWWQDAYHDGAGKSYFGEIEYDESAMTDAIPIYIPVIASPSQGVIGIIKAICAITEIKMAL